MLRLIAILSLASSILSGCESDLAVGYFSNGKNALILGLDREDIKSGDVVALQGLNLDSKLTAHLSAAKNSEAESLTESELELEVKVLSSKTAEIQIPETDHSGLKKITFKQQDKLIRTVLVLLNATEEEVSIEDLSAEQICDDTFYRNQEGELIKGTRPCGQSVDSCQEDGEINCLATLENPSVIKANLAAAVAEGFELAGVEGLAPARLPECSPTLGTNCTAVEAFPALDKANVLKPEWIRFGVEIGGVTGTYPSSTAPLDDADASVADLTSLTMNTPAGLYEFFDSEGQRYEGTVLDGGTIAPGIANQLIASGTGVYNQLTVSGDADLVAINVSDGVNLFGVVGTLDVSTPACASDGAGACIVDGTNYTAALVAGAASKILSGQTLGGVGGNITLPAANRVLTGNSYGVGGTAQSGSLTLPVAGDVKTGSAAYGDSLAQITPSYSPDFPTPANVRAPDTVDGVTGTLLDCADGGSDCFAASPTYSAAALAGAADKILSGQTIGGVGGNVTLPAVGTVLTATTYGVGGNGSTGTLTLPAATDVLSGTSAYGNPSAQLTPSYSPDFPLLTNVRAPDTVNGVTGTLLDCADGESGCFVVGPTYSAAALGGAADKILSGQSIGGIAGNITLPAVGTVLAATNYGVGGNASTGTLTLPAAFDVLTGTPAYGNPSAQLTPSYSPDFPDLANVKSIDTVNSVAGTFLPCSGDNGTNCSTSAAYPSVVAADVTAGVIKSGTVIAGVTGVYPNAANPLPVGDAHGDLDSSTFDAQIKSATSFGWFNRNGTRMTGAGDADIVDFRITSGTTIFGTTGTAINTTCSSDGQMNCITDGRYKSVDTHSLSSWDIRKNKTAGGINGDLALHRNMSFAVTYDRPSGSPGSVAGADIYDSIDDYNNNGTFPIQNPGGVTQNTASSFARLPGTDTNADEQCTGGEDCIYTDRITGLLWAKPPGGTHDWEGAISYCEGLSLVSGTLADWRLPTQKEMLQAYINGIWYHKTQLNISTANDYWSATTTGHDTTSAWWVSLHSANVYYELKSSAVTHAVMCVH